MPSLLHANQLELQFTPSANLPNTLQLLFLISFVSFAWRTGYSTKEYSLQFQSWQLKFFVSLLLVLKALSSSTILFLGFQLLGVRFLQKPLGGPSYIRPKQAPPSLQPEAVGFRK